VHVLALRMELHVPGVDTLKEKRSVITPILEGSRRRFRVASSEVGDQDRHHHAVLGFAAVSGTAGHVVQVVDDVERFVWSFPEIEVVAAERSWLEADA
jgi:uncharacterized protein